MSTSIFSLKLSPSSSSCHHLLTRRVSDGVVLIFNVPPWCNEPHLKSVLSESCGGVKALKFLQSKAETESWCSPTPPPVSTIIGDEDAVESPYFKRKTEVKFHDAIVVFKSADSVGRLMARKKEQPLVLQSETRQPLLGKYLF